MTQSFVFGARLLLVAWLVSLSTALAAQSGTFTFRMTAEPETLDWNKAHTPVETHLLMNLMEGLVSLDKDLKPVPALAKSWKISPDGKTYTFELRPGVKWSDGVPLKAQDFVYSWKRLLTPSTAAAYAYFLSDVENAEAFNKGEKKDFNEVGVKALDDHTLQVKLSHPVAHWLYIPTFWVTFPLRQDIVEKTGSSWSSPGKMVTVGPFVLSSHEMESKFVLKPNPNYYGKHGNIEQVVGLIVQDDSTALSLYESGKLDFMTDISAVNLKRMAGKPDLQKFPYLKTVYLGFVVNKTPVADPHVRKAVGMSIDRSRLGEILQGGQEPASSFVPPQMLSHSKKLGLSYDPTQAKAELKAAGISALSFELICPNTEKMLTLAQFVQGELQRNLGAKVSIQPFDHKMFNAQMDLKTYPVFLRSWSADYPDPDNFLSAFLSGSGNNRTGWKNASFDEKVLQARTLQNAKTREKLYAEAQKQLQEQDVAMVPLYYEPNLALVKSRVHGLVLDPLNDLILKDVMLGP